MKKILTALVLTLITQVAFGQKYFTVPENKNKVEYVYCHKNQNVIYDRYLKVLDSQIARLVYGIDYEESIRSSEYKMDAYRSYLLDLIVKRVFVAELKRQFNINNLNQLFGNGNRANVKLYNGKIFKLDDLKIDLNHYIHNSLANALKEHKGHTIPQHLQDEFKKELVKELVKQFAKSAYKSVGSGLVAKVIAGTLASEIAKGASKAALMSFGASVIKGAVKGTILTILTAPLLGGRKPPETIWREIYTKYPELILNPEWMNEAGSPDHPWLTHCASLLRQTESLEKTLHKILTNEESEFITAMSEINEMRDPEEVRREEMLRSTRNVAVRDNTYVKPVINPRVLQKETPFWAKK